MPRSRKPEACRPTRWAASSWVSRDLHRVALDHLAERARPATTRDSLVPQVWLEMAPPNAHPRILAALEAQPSPEPEPCCAGWLTSVPRAGFAAWRFREAIDCWRDLRTDLRDMGAEPVRVNGSSAMPPRPALPKPSPPSSGRTLTSATRSTTRPSAKPSSGTRPRPQHRHPIKRRGQGCNHAAGCSTRR